VCRTRSDLLPPDLYYCSRKWKYSRYFHCFHFPNLLRSKNCCRLSTRCRFPRIWGCSARESGLGPGRWCHRRRRRSGCRSARRSERRSSGELRRRRQGPERGPTRGRRCRKRSWGGWAETREESRRKSRRGADLGRPSGRARKRRAYGRRRRCQSASGSRRPGRRVRGNGQRGVGG